MKTKVNVKYFVTDCLWKHFFDSNLPQTPSNLISLIVLITISHFVLFQPKVRAIKLQKWAKIFLTF